MKRLKVPALFLGLFIFTACSNYVDNSYEFINNAIALEKSPAVDYDILEITPTMRAIILPVTRDDNLRIIATSEMRDNENLIGLFNAQTLIWDEEVVGSNAFWERSFPTVSQRQNQLQTRVNKLEIRYKNNTENTAIVTIQLRGRNCTWDTIAQFSVEGFSEVTTLAHMESESHFNAEMRITVANSIGHRVEGIARVRQGTS